MAAADKKPSAVAKRVRSDGSTPEAEAKKPRTSGEPGATRSYKAATEGIRVGIIHPAHPTEQLTNEQLKLVQQAVLSAIEKLPEEGPQVRFQSCTIRPGLLLLSCADKETASWMEKTVGSLCPWSNACLRLVQGADIPKPHVCVAYIPDDVESTRLTGEQVLTRLRKMNRGLLTMEWTILHREVAGPGQMWTFSVDDVSMKSLKEMDYHPYFGFGRVHFRPKSRPEPESKVGEKKSRERGPSSSAREATTTKPSQKALPRGKGKEPSSGKVVKKGVRRVANREPGESERKDPPPPLPQTAS